MSQLATLPTCVFRNILSFLGPHCDYNYDQGVPQVLRETSKALLLAIDQVSKEEQPPELLGSLWLRRQSNTERCKTCGKRQFKLKHLRYRYDVGCTFFYYCSEECAPKNGTTLRCYKNKDRIVCVCFKCNERTLRKVCYNITCVNCSERFTYCGEVETWGTSTHSKGSTYSRCAPKNEEEFSCVKCGFLQTKVNHEVHRVDIDVARK